MDAREQHVVAGRGLEHRPHWALLSQLLGGAGRGSVAAWFCPGEPRAGLLSLGFLGVWAAPATPARA